VSETVYVDEIALSEGESIFNAMHKSIGELEADGGSVTERYHNTTVEQGPTTVTKEFKDGFVSNIPLIGSLVNLPAKAGLGGQVTIGDVFWAAADAVELVAIVSTAGAAFGAHAAASSAKVAAKVATRAAAKTVAKTGGKAVVKGTMKVAGKNAVKAVTKQTGKIPLTGATPNIKKTGGLSPKIVDSIRNPSEYDIYKKSGLVENKINGKPNLTRPDFDINLKDEFGRTNGERIKQNLSPLDKSGETIELHHIGQKPDSPLAELTKSEHRGKGNDSILHDKTKESVIDRTVFNKEKDVYWNTRLKEIEKGKV
jgi:hypothetical protein